MSQTIDAFVAQLADVRTVGADGSPQDLYGLVDRLTAHFATTVGSVACRDGCITCCSSELPAVSSLEWRVIYRHLLTLPAETREGVRQMAELLRPLQPAMAHHRSLKLAQSDQLGRTPALQCPFLLNGGCSIYAARPLICRGYGYTGATLGEQTGFFGCSLASAHISAVGPKGLDLPLFDPYQAKLQALNDAEGPSTWAYLAQWLWAHLDGDGFVAEAIWAPDFAVASAPPSTPAPRRLPPNPRLRRGR
jgi:Fe-S-cluster containining protein